MTPRMARAAGFLVLLCLVGGSAAQDRDELVREFEEARPPQSVSDARSHEINGFRIFSARTRQLGADLEVTGEQVRSLRVIAGVPFRMTVQTGHSSGEAGIAVFHDESGQPMLSVSDDDGDGRLDVLTYSKLDEDGQILLTVTDYEWDGVGNATHRLSAGDCLAMGPHETIAFRNPTRKPARYILVVATERAPFAMRQRTAAA